MQCDETNFDPARADFIEQWRREMKAGGRRRDGTVSSSVHGLITVAIIREEIRTGAADVRGQRCLADGIENLNDIWRAGELQPVISLFVFFHHGGVDHGGQALPIRQQ